MTLTYVESRFASLSHGSEWDIHFLSQSLRRTHYVNADDDLQIQRFRQQQTRAMEKERLDRLADEKAKKLASFCGENENVCIILYSSSTSHSKTRFMKIASKKARRLLRDGGFNARFRYEKATMKHGTGTKTGWVKFLVAHSNKSKNG